MPDINNKNVNPVIAAPKEVMRSFGKLTEDEQEALQVMKDARTEHFEWRERIAKEKEEGDKERAKLSKERHEAFWQGVAKRVGFDREKMNVQVTDDYELVENEPETADADIQAFKKLLEKLGARL